MSGARRLRRCLWKSGMSRKLPACLNPSCRKRKVRAYWTPANVLSPTPDNVPVHSVEDIKLLMETDRLNQEPFNRV